jgi:hypothetical protein
MKRRLWFLLLLSLPAAAQESLLRVELSAGPGAYGLDRWRKDWPGCAFEGGIREGRVQRIDDASGRWLRVNFAPGAIGPDEGGAGWRLPLGRRESAEVRYTLRFSEGFEFVKGGKLPGLCGGPENVSGGRPADGHNGFSARLMWRRDGRGEAYLYHMDQPEKYGHSFPFPDDFRFPTGKPVRVRLAVTMNAPGRSDGVLRVWITLPESAERLVVERQDLRWRATDAFGVDSLYFETFHGGSDVSWAPKKPCWAEFSELAVFSAADGSAR